MLRIEQFKMMSKALLLIITILLFPCLALSQQTDGGLWDIPTDVRPPDYEIKGQTHRFDSPFAMVTMSLMDYRENCLPVPDNFKEIMEQSAYREGTYTTALGLIKSAPNKCEAAVEVKLFFESQKGQWTFDRFVTEAKDTGMRVLISAVIQKYIIGMAVNPTLTIGIKFSDLLYKEFKQREVNKTIQEALELFRSTRGNSLQRIRQIDTELQAKIANIEKQIEGLTVKYGQKLESYRPNHPYNRFNPSTAWLIFFEKEQELAKQEASEKADLLTKIASLEIRRAVLNQYRRPIVEKSCEDVIKDLKESCPHKTKTSDKDTVETIKQPAYSVPRKMDTLSQKDKDALYQCICRCTINPTLGVGASYNPNPIYGVMSSPSCEDPRYGPCVGAGYGCWRKHMDTSGECFEQCLKDVNVDKNSAVAEINKMRQDAFNDFIKEAMQIIKEYINFVPGVYKKKAGNPYHQEIPNVLLASSELFLISDNTTKGLLAQKEVPMTYLEMIKEKNRQGHPDRAIALVKSAESIMPERKGEIHNVLAEMAIMLSKATLNIVTELEFDEGLYMLNKALEIYKVGEDSSIGRDIKRHISNLQRWKQDWQVLQEEVPKCMSMLKQRQVCQCDKLFQAKIYPSAVSLTIYEFASSERWNISTATGFPRPIPKKDKLFSEVQRALISAKADCDAHSIFKTPEMKALIDYERTKSLEKSPYIDQNQIQKHYAPEICGIHAVRYAEKILSTPDLCDCHRDRLRAIIDIAKKDGEPMTVEFNFSSNEIEYGNRVDIRLQIVGGKGPFYADMTGSYNYSKGHDNSRGFHIAGWMPDSVGKKVFKVTVRDACGEIIEKEAYVNVKPSQAMVKCEGKWAEGTSLYNQKRYNEALVKFKENLTCAPNNQERRNYVAQLENTLKQQEAQRQACMNLRRQGDSLVQQKRLKEAVVQYREHLRCNPDRQLEDYIRSLEDTIKKEEEQRQRYEYAKRLRSEGEQLQKANRIQEAITKYRESLRYLPDSELEKHIRELELAMARPTPTPSPTYSPPVVTTPQSMNLTGSWVGRCEGMTSEYSIEVRHSGNTFTAKSKYDEYSGTITGNQIRGRSKTGDDVVGMIINSNKIRVTINYASTALGRSNCELQRTGGYSSSGDSRSYGNAQNQQHATISAEFINRSSENVHIFVDGQDTFGPHNRLTPNERKRVNISSPSRAGFIKFNAGRGGQVLGSCRWEYDPDNISGRIPVVTFTNPNILSCTTGLR